MPRYTRDEIIIQGIELSSSPTLIQHDIPGGIVQENAHSIKWLQNALDFFHRKCPFSTDVQSVSVTIQSNSEDLVLTATPSLYLPADFMLDVRNGIVVESSSGNYRLERKSFQYWLSYRNGLQNATTTTPRMYCIINSRIKVAPLLSSPQACTLWYYALPVEIGPEDYPPFPDEWTLIEFIRIKALEWTRSIEVGTAQVYFTKQLAGLRAAGLLNDTEYDIPPLENNQVFPEGPGGVLGRNAWMGHIAI